MSGKHPKDWDTFEVIRKGNLIEVWIPPVDSLEGSLVIQYLNSDYVPSLIAALCKFEQSEGRKHFK